MSLRVERDGPVLRVTLARPERRNAFDAALIAELTAAFADVGDARAVVLAGEGASFCAGGDVAWMRASVDLSLDENVEDALDLGRMLEAVDACPAPVVAPCRATRSAAGRASSPAATWRSPIRGRVRVQRGEARDRAGRDLAVRAREDRRLRGAPLFVTGERFDADAALRIGLVHELADDLGGAVERVVGELLTAGPEAARVAKSLARAPHSLEETARLIAESRAGDEGQEGLRAFLAGGARAARGSRRGARRPTTRRAPRCH